MCEIWKEVSVNSNYEACWEMLEIKNTMFIKTSYKSSWVCKCWIK